MAFKYYGDQTQGLRGLDFSQPEQPEQPQQPGMDPSAMMQIGSQFMGGGSPVAGGGAIEAGTGLQATGGGAASSGSGMGSAAASAGPWAALAAIIAVNEYNAVKGGYRSEDKGEYAKDLFSGEVFHQDMEQRWLPKLGLEEGSKENKVASVLANPMAITGDPVKSFERIKDLF